MPDPAAGGGASAAAAPRLPRGEEEGVGLAGATSDSSSPRLRAGGVVLRPGPARGAASPEGADSLEVLLISRRRAPESFTVPAGKFEDNIDCGDFEVCALRETREEAGVECEVLFDLGCYSGLAKDTSETQTRFFAMSYRGDSNEWKEGAQRVRSWQNLDEALRLVEWNSTVTEVLRKVRSVLRERAKAGRDPLAKLAAVPAAELRTGSGGSGAGTRRSASAASMSSDDSDGMAQLMALPETEEPLLDSAGPSGEEQPPPVDEPAAPPAAAREETRQRRAGSGQAEIARKMSFEELSKVRISDVDGEQFGFYRNQVGGHFPLVKPAPESRWICIKPHGPAESVLPAQRVVLKPRDDREHQFYKEILTQVPSFVPHMSPFFGTKTLTHCQVSAITAKGASRQKASEEESGLEMRMRSHQFQEYIVLQDLACAFKKPHILDLKMGFKQRSKRHSLRKRERCKQKALSSTSHLLGFRICGVSTEVRVYDKYWGRRLPAAEMRGALAEFFLHPRASAEERHALVSHLLERLRGLREIVAGMPQRRFWNTSLLFLFDGADLGAEPDMRLIDFAHCGRVGGSGPDAEFLAALRNIEAFLEAVRDDHPFDPWIAERLVPRPDEGVQDAEELEGEDEGSPGPQEGAAVAAREAA